MDPMEPFQVVASALSVVEIAFRFYSHFSAFITNARHANQNLEDLQSSAERLKDLRSVVRNTLESRKAQLEPQKPTEAEKVAWRYIRDTLGALEGTRRRFRPIVKDLTAAGASGKFRLQFSFNKHESVLRDLREDMARYQGDLAVAMTCLHMHKNSPAPIEEPKDTQPAHAGDKSSTTNLLSTRLERTGVQEINHDMELKDDDGDENYNICHELNNAVGVFASSLNDAASLDDEVSDLDGIKVNFDDSAPPEVLEALIKAFQDLVRSSCAAAGVDTTEKVPHYQTSERYQRKLIATIRKWNDFQAQQEKIDLDPFFHQLAQFIRAQGRLSEAVNILRNQILLRNEQSNRRPSQASNIDATRRASFSQAFRELARINLQQYKSGADRDLRYLDEAMDFAKRSFRYDYDMQHEETTNLKSSAQILVELLKERGETVEAEVYHNLFLQPTSRSTHDSRDTTLLQLTDRSREHNVKARFMAACRSNRVEEMEQLLESRDIAQVNADDYKAALLDAVLRGNEDMADTLCNHGANPNVVCGKMTLLNHAIHVNKPHMVKLLLTRGADITIDCPSGKSLLFHAIRKRNAAIVKLLCEAGLGGMDTVNKDGYTPLHYSIHLQSPGVTEALLQHGADANLECDGNPPMHFAITYDCPPHFTGKEFFRLLIEHNADVNKKDKYQRTPLIRCIENDDKLHLLEILLQSPEIIVDEILNIDSLSSRVRSKLKQHRRLRGSETREALGSNVSQLSVWSSISEASSSQRSISGFSLWRRRR